MGRPKAALNWVLIRVHRSVFVATRGRLLDRLAGMPVLMLATTGRRTGARLETMLTVPVVEGDQLVLVASNGGNPKEPDWCQNLRAQPEVEVLWRGARRQMVARLASPSERSRLWPRVVAAYAGYARYQARSPREIPLVLLSPSRAADAPGTAAGAERPPRR
jgi:deazaflavin-dependent oxidoreductase (nitroreductase family)